MQDIPETTPDSVVQHLHSTQDVYFSGNLMATSVLAKATLERIFTEFMPTGSSRTSLSKLIQDSSPSINLDEPLTNLSASLRKDGTLDQLIGAGQTMDQASADVFMQLLEHLITYLYVIPDEFRKIDEVFAALGKAKKDEQVRVNRDAKRGSEIPTKRNRKKAA